MGITIIEQQTMHAIQQIPQQLKRIADALEKQKPQVDPNSLGAYAIWKDEVARSGCLVGFADWQAWHDQPTPEQVGEAIQAVKRGFDEIEEQVRGDAAE
jgi:hypothetical protein